MKEIWKNIKGYENIYQISNMGNVKSFYYSKKKYPDGKKLKICFDKRYYFVRLYTKETLKNKLIHRLIAEAFIKKDNKLKNQINHKDGNKLNNNINNLEWVTCSENTKHAYKNGLRKAYWKNKRLPKEKFKNFIYCQKGKKSKRQLKIKMINDNNNVLKIYESITQASVETNIGLSSIANCLKRRSNSAGGYKWNYV